MDRWNRGETPARTRFRVENLALRENPSNVTEIGSGKLDRGTTWEHRDRFPRMAL